MMENAQKNDVFQYDTNLIHKLKQIFTEDMADNMTISASDLKKVFYGLETLDSKHR